MGGMSEPTESIHDREGRKNSGVTFRKLLEDAARYPVPRAPTFPVFSPSVLRSKVESDWRSTFLEGPTWFLPSARAAMALALRRLTIIPGDRVLLPAYHCGSLVEPALKWIFTASRRT